MATTKHHIALSGDPSAPYVVSFVVHIDSGSVQKKLKLSYEGALRFAKRHNVPMPKEPS